MSLNKNQQINVNPKDLENIVCEKCSSSYFRQAQILKRMSPLISPTGKEQRLALPVIRCDDCGHVNEEFDQF